MDIIQNPTHLLPEKQLFNNFSAFKIPMYFICIHKYESFIFGDKQFL